MLVAANSDLPDPAGVKVVRVETTAELRDEVLGRAAPSDAVVMAAAPGGLRGRHGHRLEDQEAGGRLGPVRSTLVQNPDILRELCAQRPRPDMVVVGFAAETGDERGHRAGARAGQAPPQGLRPAGGQRRVRRARSSERREPGRSPGPGRRVGRRAPWVPRRRWRTPSGTRSWRRLSGEVASGRRGRRPLGWTSARRRKDRDARDRTTLHLRGRDRGAPGQDRRPDQRHRPGRAPRQRPAQPGCGRDADHHRPGRGGRGGHHLRLRTGRRAGPRAHRVDRLRRLGEGVRRPLVRGAGGDRLPVGRHRPGRRRRLRGAPRSLGRPAGPAGRRATRA